VPGSVVDQAIGNLLLELMQPITLEVAFAAQQEVELRISETDALRSSAATLKSTTFRWAGLKTHSISWFTCLRSTRARRNVRYRWAEGTMNTRTPASPGPTPMILAMTD